MKEGLKQFYLLRAVMISISDRYCIRGKHVRRTTKIRLVDEIFYYRKQTNWDLNTTIQNIKRSRCSLLLS